MHRAVEDLPSNPLESSANELPPANSRPTVARALDVYRERVSILKKGFAQEIYRINLLQRSFLGGLIVPDVTSVHIAKYRDWRLATLNEKTGKPISPSTVRLEMSLLSNFFELARIEWGFTEAANPCANVRKPKPAPGRTRRLAPREERALLRYCANHANTQLFSIVVLALATAMRQGEILKLRWENINLKSRIAHLPDTKNGAARDVPLSPAARDALIRLGPQPGGKIFAYTANGFKSTWRFLCEKLSIVDLHFHDLRHEATSRLFELGTLDMMEIASITGHKSLAMLKRYTHLKASRLVKKLDGNRNRSRQAVLNDLVPYPAAITTLTDGNVEIRLPDFEPDPIRVIAGSTSKAVAKAQDALLRRIMQLMRHGSPIPAPDNFLEVVASDRIIFIDPMATETLLPA